MKQYLDLLNRVINEGVIKENRTGVDTKSIFGHQMRFDLNEGFPAVTTKKLAWKSVVSELLWFIEGSCDERRLAEILYGTRDESKKTIWTENAEAPYWKPKAKFPGDLGRVYGVQWRDWRGPVQSTPWHDRPTKENTVYDDQHSLILGYKKVDQLQILIDGLKKDPNGRRHILTAWNPGELDQMALPPCHLLAQFDLSNNILSCQLYIRSNDIGLGAPFNIASYALFTHMIAQVCNLGVGELIYTIGDAHIYVNHHSQIIEQLMRDPYPLPTLLINPKIKNIEDFKMNDFSLLNYQHHKSIKMDMAV